MSGNYGLATMVSSLQGVLLCCRAGSDASVLSFVSTGQAILRESLTNGRLILTKTPAAQRTASGGQQV